MRKLISILLITASVMSLTACGQSKEAIAKKEEKVFAQMEKKEEENIIKLQSDKIDLSNLSYEVSEKERDGKLEEAIAKTLNYNEKTDGPLKYYYNKIDLNGDGKAETFVYLVGQYVSGSGGSTALIFEGEKEDYKLISNFTLVRNPIIVSSDKTNGWNDLIMYVSGGGIEPFYSQIKFDGNKYPSNPSVQPEVKTGKVVKGKAIIADDIQKNQGIELQ
ncbi:hypothetical protein GCM10008905_19700 [Clostridium malenominatum]|uniref:Lipoprotein n=1 Tax=Clostridium malenominatum TaxID=1539 RepID=A0ABP3UA59_9CLOT